MTADQLKALITSAAAAQSILLATILRTFVVKGLITEAELNAALEATEQAAVRQRTPETPLLTGLIDLLRRDLGLGTKTPRDPT